MDELWKNNYNSSSSSPTKKHVVQKWRWFQYMWSEKSLCANWTKAAQMRFRVLGIDAEQENQLRREQKKLWDEI